jgi:N-acetylmuramic acid 6-phosphate etherase
VTTERRNPRSVDIDLFPTERVLRIINGEDALGRRCIASRFRHCKAGWTLRSSHSDGGHVIYVGAGTSGRIA